MGSLIVIYVLIFVVRLQGQADESVANQTRSMHLASMLREEEITPLNADLDSTVLFNTHSSAGRHGTLPSRPFWPGVGKARAGNLLTLHSLSPLSSAHLLHPSYQFPQSQSPSPRRSLPVSYAEGRRRTFDVGGVAGGAARAAAEAAAKAAAGKAAASAGTAAASTIRDAASTTAGVITAAVRFQAAAAVASACMSTGKQALKALHLPAAIGASSILQGIGSLNNAIEKRRRQKRLQRLFLLLLLVLSSSGLVYYYICNPTDLIRRVLMAKAIFKGFLLQLLRLL